MKMNIAIILPNLNGAKYLEAAIKSFLAQQNANAQLIIIDGKSSDGSHAIIERYADGSRVKWVRELDAGISSAINMGIANSDSEIVGYLGGDDQLWPGALAAIEHMASVIDFDALMMNSYTYYVAERRTVLQRPVVHEVTVPNLLHHGTIAGLQNTFYRRRALDGMAFNESNRTAMDYEMLLELASRGKQFAYLDQVATVNYFDGNISHNNDRQALEAALVARRFCPDDYYGPMVGEHLLSAEKKRPKPPFTRRVLMKARGLTRRLAGL